MAFNQVTWPYRFLFLLVLSVALMIVDHRSQLLSAPRATISTLVLPLQILVRLPPAIGDWFSAHYPDDDLFSQYTALKEENLALQTRLQRYESLREENRRLADLLGATQRTEGRATLAEIIEIGLDPFTHRLALNRGTEAGVYLGQPVVTTEGVLGQISGFGVLSSVVTLITDPAHALPVQVQRNGLRTIIRGLGEANRVEVPFLSAQADIRADDILVTSGIGGGFPAGYKVARVREIAVDANRAFMKVDAIPFANIDFTRAALLLDRPTVRSDDDEESQQDNGNDNSSSSKNSNSNNGDSDE